jgi:hypothetical protein
MRRLLLPFVIVAFASAAFPQQVAAPSMREINLAAIKALKIRDAIAALLFPFPAMQGVGVQYRGDNRVREVVFRVYRDVNLVSPPIYDQLLVRGIDLFKLGLFDTPSNVVPKEIERNLYMSPQIEIDGVRYVVQDVPTQTIHAFGARFGDSTSNKAGCYEGSVGFAVVAKANAYLKGYITCNHVAAAEGPLMCPNGQAVREYVPGTSRNMCESGESVGVLYRRQPIDFNLGVANSVDAAFVRADNVQPDHCGINPTDNPVQATPWLKVRKCGAASYLTEGHIKAIQARLKVLFLPCGLVAEFADQIEVDDSGFALSGDSGAGVVGPGDDPVGIVFAGDEVSQTFINPIQKVLDYLDVKIMPRRP